MTISWLDADQPWWCKLRRADKHIKELSVHVDAFLNRRPFTILAEPGRGLDEIAFRFSVQQAAPSDLSATVGDAVHNLRSSLDSVAYSMARHHLASAWTGANETQSSFPITSTPAKFGDFIRRNRQLFGFEDERALRSVQPFALAEEVKARNVVYPINDEHEFLLNDLNRMNQLWNIDKHRRLPNLCWFARLSYHYAGEADQNIYEPLILAPGAKVLPGQVLGCLRTRDGSPPNARDAYHEIGLRLDDDLLPSSAVETLGDWHRNISAWIIPRLAGAHTTGSAPLLTARPSGLASWTTSPLSEAI